MRLPRTGLDFAHVIWCNSLCMAETHTAFVYYGSDEGAAGVAAAAKYAELTRDTDEWGNEMIDGAVATVDEAVAIVERTLSGLQMVNMFGGRKVIWLRAANFMGDTPSGARSEAVQAALDTLVSGLENLPPDVFFVLSASEMDKRRVFFKKLGQVAEMSEYTRIDISKPGWESEVTALTLKLAKPKGLNFDNAAINLFVQRVNESTRQIANELEKLDVYLGAERRKITEQDVELMVAISRHGVIFEISRALEKQDSRQAVRLVNEQLEQGEQAVTIMRAAIVPTVRNRYCARLLLDTYRLDPSNYRSFESALNRLPPEARKFLPLKKDGTPNCYSIRTAAMSISKLTLRKAKQDLLACARADRQLVSSQADARDVLHKLIIQLTS